ncbi:MAG: hypothetical protein DRP57_04330 [Spirochaetes bacterium]|nr:MAG: hypothetical protein DRP57_04330 [Spirochaetota bacterium]
MRSNQLKFLAEQSEEEYEEYCDECLKEGIEPQDIYLWVQGQIADAEEARFEYEREDWMKDK